MTKRIVLALGGNALQQKGEVTAEAQKNVAKKVGKIVAKLSQEYEIILTHGNGPQIGNIMLHEEQADCEKAPAMPLETAVAMSQGQIGYWITQAIDNAFIEQGINKHTATIVTQIVIDKNDPAFKDPTKPIGQFYSEKQAKRLARLKGWTVKEDAGRGWRRVVPSPKPLDIIEKNEIIGLVKSGAIVIAAGGGGVPVYRTKIRQKLKGIDAVIDKDFASERLAELAHADIFVSLTAVPNAYINFGKPNQTALGLISRKTADAYIKQDYFAAGSMLPKMEAALKFAKLGKTGIITNLDQLELALEQKAGTIIK